MTISPLTRWLWFLSSWFPALLLWMLFALSGHQIWAFCAFTLLSLSLLTLYMVLNEMASMSGPQSSQVTILRTRDRENQCYMVWYVLPLLIQPWTSVQSAVALLIVVAMVGTIYVRGELLHINPVLFVLGYRLYEVQLENDTQTYLLLAQQHLSFSKPLNLVRLSDQLLWVTRSR